MSREQLVAMAEAAGVEAQAYVRQQLATAGFETQPNHFQWQNVATWPSALIDIYTIRIGLHQLPSTRAAAERTASVKALTSTTIKINTSPKPSANARLPLLVSSAIVVVITRVR